MVRGSRWLNRKKTGGVMEKKEKRKQWGERAVDGGSDKGTIVKKEGNIEDGALS